MISGPLPSAQQIEEYNRSVPGSGEILFAEFQAQSKHRRAMERIIIISDAARANLGLLIGGGIGVYLVWAGADLLRHGHSLQGFSEIGVAIATAAGPFVFRSYLQSQERRRQQEALSRRVR